MSKRAFKLSLLLFLACLFMVWDRTVWVNQPDAIGLMGKRWRAYYWRPGLSFGNFAVLAYHYPDSYWNAANVAVAIRTDKLGIQFQYVGPEKADSVKERTAIVGTEQ